MSATSTKTHSASSKSSRRVAFADAVSDHNSGVGTELESRNESVLDLADMDPGDQVVLDMADHPPAPTTAASDGLESALTIYTPGDEMVHIPQLGGLRRESCEWTNTNLPCINKVAAHLAALQRQLEVPRELTYDEMGRLENMVGPTPGMVNSIKVTSLTSNPGLEVVDEVKTLIARLEQDRQQTIRAYQREVERVKLLQVQVDKVERRRLYILPKAVQLEHEACTQDISELRWDLDNWLEEKKEMEKQVLAAVDKNRNLQSSIEELTAQCPNIKEKLEIDKECLEGISADLKEAKAQLESVHVEMNEAKNKSSLADGRAESERIQLRSELASIRKTLAGVQGELQEAEDVNATHNADIEELNNAIDTAKMDGSVLDSEIAEAKKQERESQSRVNTAKINLLEVAENIKARRRANKRLSEQMAEKVSQRQLELENRDKKKQRTLRFDKSMLREALQSFVKMEREILDFKKELTVSIKKARDDEKATSRAQAELKHLDQQLQVVVEEVQKLAELNAKLSLEAHRTEEDIVNTETALRNNLTMLRKTLQDEIQAKTSLSNKMESEAEDFEKYQGDSSRKLTRTQKKKNDLEAIHQKYSNKKDDLSNKLTGIHTDRDKLQAEIDHTATTFKAEKEDLEKQITLLKPEEKQVREESEETQKAINDLQWRNDLVSKKIQECLDATRVVMKIQKQTDDQIADLGKKIENFENDLTAGQETEKQLQSNLNHIRDNQLLLRNQHKARLDKRVTIFNELKETVAELIGENQRNSEAYTVMQKRHLKVKGQYQRILDSKLGLEISVNEITKVAALQRRMHKALVSYYMHRGYHNRIVLTDFGKGAAVNLHQLEKIHRNLYDVIAKTDVYLDKHGSGVSRKQPRVSTPDLKKAETDMSRLPIIIETPPPPKEARSGSGAESEATTGAHTRPATTATEVTAQ
ncbi:coiled-coil domain-containing protein 178-like isoform X1 [Bolinopsis microptera]|uniref:coiled-coil domain-containing protein 178-like isoform X1 n=1 Tax=Bolinopsis microptera TaxID=2820187 RepID=UPI00307A3CE1